MKLPDRMSKVLLLVPVLMFLGLTVFEGIVFLLQKYLEMTGNEMLLPFCTAPAMESS